MVILEYIDDDQNNEAAASALLQVSPSQQRVCYENLWKDAPKVNMSNW